MAEERKTTVSSEMRNVQLSELTNSSVSAITRAAVIKYMQYNQDEEGNVPQVWLVF